MARKKMVRKVRGRPRPNSKMGAKGGRKGSRKGIPNKKK
jgi:hypothetical protein